MNVLAGPYLSSDLDRVRQVLSDGQWYTLDALCAAANVKALNARQRIHDLRKRGYHVQTSKMNGTCEYCMPCADAMTTLTREEAQSITDQLRGQWQGAQDAVDGLKAAMWDAKERGVHVALGYASWTAYLAQEFKDAGVGLDTKTRRGLVHQLSAMGMSTRAVAAVVGVSHVQIAADAQVLSDLTPACDTPIAGRDGKTYKRPDKSRAAVQARVAQMRALAESGATSRQIAAAVGLGVEATRARLRREGIEVRADQVVKGQHRHDANRIVEQMVMDLEHLVEDIGLIEFAALDEARVPAWRESLRACRKALAAFERRLEEK